MDEPASALDPIATTRIEDLMHELKNDYTIVVVTHNMQQAARVADMTAFFSVERGEEGQRTGILVEYDATHEDLHAAVRPADGGLRHGAVRLMRVGLQEELDILQATLMEEGELVLRALRGALEALEQRDPELADEVIAFDDEVDARYRAIQAGDRVAARAPDAGRRRPAHGARAACTSTCTSSAWPTTA